MDDRQVQGAHGKGFTRKRMGNWFVVLSRGEGHQATARLIADFYVAISRILIFQPILLYACLPARGIDRVTFLFESAGHKSVMLFPISSQPSPRAVCIRDGAAARVPFSWRQGLAPR